MKKVINCYQCGNHMVYTDDKDAKAICGELFQCSCGRGLIVPPNNPNVFEIEENKILKATNEQRYKAMLCSISDIINDYDGCKTVESLKELIDGVRESIKFALKEE